VTRAATTVGLSPVRILRSGVFTAVMVTLSLLAHALAGGMLPGPTVAVAAALALGVLSYPLTGHERGLPVVLGATGAAQLALHVTFTLSMLPACAAAGVAKASTGTTAVATMAGMGGPADRLSASCTAGSWSEAGARGALLMTLTHVVAGLLSAYWLRRGERAVTRIARLLWPLLLLLWHPVSTAGRPPLALSPTRRPWLAHPADHATFTRLLLVRLLSRRGPPLALAV
jgi:hypothetical protein